MARGGWWGFRIELTLAEMAAVVGGAVGSAFVIFLLGAWVGKGWEARRLKDEQQVIRIPVERQATAPERKEEKQMEFYDVLTRPHASPAAALAAGLASTPRPPVHATPKPAPMVGNVPERKPTAAVGPRRRTPPRGKWSVQVLASKDQEAATRLIRSLGKNGFRAYVVKLRSQGQTRYRVRVGPFPSLEKARKAARRLRGRAGVTETFVASE